MLNTRKFKIIGRSPRVHIGFSIFVIGLALAWLVPVSLAQTLYVTNEDAGTVGAYDATTGADFAGFSSPTGLDQPDALAISGGNLYVGTYPGGQTYGSVTEYNAATGAAIPAFNLPADSVYKAISLAVSDNVLYVGTQDPFNGSVYAFNATTGAAIAGFTSAIDYPIMAVAASGSSLYVAYDNPYVGDEISELNATTGAIIPGFTSPTGLSFPDGLAVSGSNLYVLNYGSTSSFVGEYNATTGAAIAGFTSPSGLQDARGMAMSGDDLYIANTYYENPFIGEYDAATGDQILGFTSPSVDSDQLYYGIVVSPVPEPETWTLFAGGAGLLLAMPRFVRRRVNPSHHSKTSPFSAPLSPPGPRLRSTPNCEDFAAGRQRAPATKIESLRRLRLFNLPVSHRAHHPTNRAVLRPSRFCSPPPHLIRVRLLDSLNV